MTTRFSSALTTFALLFCAISSHAQYAYIRVELPTEETAKADPEEGVKTVTYKMVHGVVQGQKGALPGATVWLHGTPTVVVTNSEGEFELRVPTDAKMVELTCGYGGLQEEVVRLAAVQSLGSVYLLRAKGKNAMSLATK